jgi:hypothetical protein
LPSRVFWDDHATWRFENGWQRDIEGRTSNRYREFQQDTFAEIHETPVTSPKKKSSRRR